MDKHFLAERFAGPVFIRLPSMDFEKYSVIFENVYELERTL